MLDLMFRANRTALTVFTFALRLAATPVFASEADSSSPRQACNQPDVSAATAYAAPAALPEIATALNVNGTTYVRVDLDAGGGVRETSVWRSSGVPLLDRAAVKAAQESRFQPEIRNCAPVAGTYLFVVEFPAD